MLELAVLSAAFAMGAAIPDRYACAPFSPPLSWSEIPAGTQSIAVLCDDSDAPAGDWVHWVLFNLAPDVRALPENVARDAALPGDAVQGVNDYDRHGYDGPCPPWNDSIIHHYVFTVYALDVETLPLTGKFGGPEVRAAMQGHILAEASLTGTYTLNPKLGL